MGLSKKMQVTLCGLHITDHVVEIRKKKDTKYNLMKFIENQIPNRNLQGSCFGSGSASHWSSKKFILLLLLRVQLNILIVCEE
jgi:hypothetical protein